MKSQVIKFESSIMPGPPPEPIILTPKSIGWSNIIRKMTDLQVSKWDAEYCDFTIMDGRDWSLTVRSVEINMRSKGLNAYPPNFDAVRDVIERSAACMPTPVKTSYARKPKKCPSCSHTPVASILYGMPSISDELFEKEERGEVIFGGCVIERDQPTWQCSKCRAEFYNAT
jgi:hypothetical protein